MKTYVADFIPRFKKFSKKLDASSLLTNQHWVLVDDIEASKTKYIFRRRITKLIDKSPNLVVSKDGIVNNGVWELLDSSTLLITLGGKSFLFKHGFLDDNVLALKLDGKNEYALFFNESRIDGELNSVGSMHDFLEEKYSNESVTGSDLTNSNSPVSPGDVQGITPPDYAKGVVIWIVSVILCISLIVSLLSHQKVLH